MIDETTASGRELIQQYKDDIGLVLDPDTTGPVRALAAQTARDIESELIDRADRPYGCDCGCDCDE